MEPGPKFLKNGYCTIARVDGCKVLLSKSTWEKKLTYREREYLRYNFGKIKETVSNPDNVRVSQKNKKTHLYYKRYDGIWLLPNIHVPFPSGFVCVVVKDGEDSKFVQTFYPTGKIKK